MDTVVQNTTVNAPLDDVLWLNADWQQVTRNVRRIQCRIVKATQEQAWRKVHNLQRLLTRSLSAKLLAVKRVVLNNGSRTPGIDGRTWRSSQAKSQAVLQLKTTSYQAKPLKRVYIPKSNGGRRPLGIPTVHDRAMQALYALALEPVAETQADDHSYGFRPRRSTHDAIEQCFVTLSRRFNAQWVLEADIEGCFDNIHHEWLLKHIPIEKKVLKQWLKAGFVEQGQRHPTETGTPQGGVISPTLMNLTLDGLEAQLEAAFGQRNTSKSYANQVHLVRYADDFIITGRTPELLEKKVKPIVETFLLERGLKLSHKKTRITSIHKGFDFLGQTVRKFHQTKLLIKPSKKSQKPFKEKLSHLIQALRTAPQSMLIDALNPVIKGWGNYHQHVVSKRIFNNLDNWLGEKLWRWACRRHPKKNRTWVAKKYYHTIGNNHWVFGYQRKTSNGDTILKPLKRLATIPIKRHVKIKGNANPYDPDWELYFEQREDAQMRRVQKGKALALYKRQSGQCGSCQQPITPTTGWNVHHKLEKTRGGNDCLDNLVLLHPHCHRQIHGRLKAGLPVAGSLSHA